MKYLVILLIIIINQTECRILTKNFEKNQSVNHQLNQNNIISQNNLKDPNRKAGVEYEFGFFPCTYQERNLGQIEKGKIKDGIKLKFDFVDTDFYMLGYDKSSIYSDSYKEEKKNIYKNFFLETTNFFDYEFRTIGGLSREQIFSGMEALKNFYNPICENLKNSEVDNFVLNHNGIDLCISDRVNLQENEKLYIYVKPQFTFDIKIEDFPEYLLKIKKNSDFVLKSTKNLLLGNGIVLESQNFLSQLIIDSMNYFKGILDLNGRKENFFIIMLFSNCFVLDQYSDNENEKEMVVKYAKNNVLKVFFQFLPRYPDYKILQNNEILETFYFIKENKLNRILPFIINFRDTKIKEDFKNYIRIEIEQLKDELKKIPEITTNKGEIKVLKEKQEFFQNLDQENKNKYRLYQSLISNLEKNGFFEYSFENYLIDLLIFQKYQQYSEEDFEREDFQRCQKDHIFNCLYLTNNTKLLATTMVPDFVEGRIILEYRALNGIKDCQIDREVSGLLNMFFEE